MTYPDAIQFLYDLRLFGLKLGLENTFKLAALASMKTTIDSLSKEVARAQVYVERAHAAELAQAQANGLTNELSLPTSQGGA